MLEKISDSIRAFTYLVLTSQSAARHGILGENAQAIAAQRLFYYNLEDVINKLVSLQDDIRMYQSVLKYARSNLDYSVGEGLYMVPSDILIKPLNQVIDECNDKIVVNTSVHALGKVAPSLPRVTTKPRSKMARPGVRHPYLQSRMRPLEVHNEEKQAQMLGLVGLALFAIW